MDECIICNTVSLLQELQCKHKYCILCIKGLINTTPKCPICRAAISDLSTVATTITDKYTSLWLYQGRTGWWVFDDELQEKLSSALREGKSFTWLVSSQRIHFDVVNMVQENLDTGIVRYIKTINIDDISKYEIRGVSGVPLKRLKD